MKSLGCVAYEAYCESSGGKSLISGAPLPPWGELKPEIRAAWEAAASAVRAIGAADDDPDYDIPYPDRGITG